MIARSYFLLGTSLLTLGILLGMFIGATEEYRLATVHAHINLLGFVLTMIFGLVFHVVPTMAASGLARIQLWLHGVGVIGMLVMLLFYKLDHISAATMGMSLPFQLAILAGIVTFLVNIQRNYRA